MSTNIVLVDVHTSIRDAAKKMTDSNASFIIISENYLPVGIVTHKDLVKRNIAVDNPTDVDVREIMSTPLIHSGPDQSIWEVADLMHARDIKTIPIIDEYDKLLGVVSIMAMIKALSLLK